MNTPIYISALYAPLESAFAATASCDFYKVHQLVCLGFPNVNFKDQKIAQAVRVQFRFETEGHHGVLYVQSCVQPSWDRIAKECHLRVVGPVPLVLPEMAPGTRLRFRLLARPTKRIGQKGNPLKGKRRALTSEVEQRLWLDRKGEEHGFRVESCTLLARYWNDTKSQKLRSGGLRGPEKLPNGALKPLWGVQFDGVLVVTDPEKLRLAVRNGVGTQKGYGFGLLSLASLGS